MTATDSLLGNHPRVKEAKSKKQKKRKEKGGDV
jgi:hypothetical protein